MANSFCKEGIILEEEKGIVRFGLESLGGNLTGIVLTLTVGIFFKQVGAALLLWLLLFPLRKNAGGYHAGTKKRCLLMSIAMLIVAFMLFTVFEGTRMFYVICAVSAGCVIWFLAPVDNPSKELDAVEYKVYRRRTRIVLGVESIFFVLVLSFKWEMAVQSSCMTFFIVSTSLIMGAIKLLLGNKYKRYD